MHMAMHLVEAKAPTPKRFPLVPPLRKMPSTIEELFRSLAVTVLHRGAGRYAWPWEGWTGSKDARTRLEHFERSYDGQVGWAPFNGTESNDGPMTLNACSGHAFVEGVTNGGDALLELAAASHKGPMPASPTEAVRVWYGDVMGANENSSTHIEVRMFSTGSGKRKNTKEQGGTPKNNVLDCRDYGIGLTAAEMPATILSLNRGNKQHKSYLTGKHGQGASSQYQYSDLTIIASRKYGTSKIAFTIIEKQWTPGAKTPTYRYLTVDGKIPEVSADEFDFAPGTLVRHVGYEGEFYNSFGERSIYGLLQRSLARPLFPIHVYYHSMFVGTSEKTATGIGAGDHRFVKGTVNTLEQAYNETLNPPKKARPQQLAEIAHRDSFVFNLGDYDFGGRAGVQNAGKVRITYWAARPEKREKGKKAIEPRAEDDVLKEQRAALDVVRNWVLPEKPILFTLDGQTHAEEDRAYITSQQGAKLWAVGKLMVVQIDCDGLSKPAKYEMFTSTREALKDTQLKWKIVDEIVRLLSIDKRLRELNAEFAAGPRQSDEVKDASFADKIREYLKKSGVPFEKITRRMTVFREVPDGMEEGPGEGGDGAGEGGTGRDGGSPNEPPPIPSQDPPRFIRWKFRSSPIKLAPGAKYSWVFETDAPTSYWNPDDPMQSRILLSANGVYFETLGDMKGGRVRCHFRCPETMRPGQRAAITVQLFPRVGDQQPAESSIMYVEVIEPSPGPKPPGGRPKPGNGSDTNCGNGDGNGAERGPGSNPGSSTGGTGTAGTGDGEALKVKLKRKKFTETIEVPVLRPIPLLSNDHRWGLLGWGMDKGYGFSVRSDDGAVQLFYNAEFAPYTEALRDMTRRGVAAQFRDLYEIKLVLHTIFQLNHGFFVDEEDAKPEVKRAAKNLIAAAAEDLINAVETEINLKLQFEQETV